MVTAETELSKIKQELTSAHTRIRDLKHHLVQQDRKQKAIIDAIPDLVFHLDKNGYYLDFHVSNTADLYAPKNSIIGSHLSDALPEHLAQPALEKIKQALASKDVVYWEYSIDMPNNETKHCEVRFTQCGKDQVLAISRDTTLIKLQEQERLETERKLQQAHKMEALGTLTGGIAHDFNNILGALLGYAEMLLPMLKAESKQYLYLTRIHDSGVRAKKLVAQILTFSQNRVTDLHPGYIEPIIKESVDLMRSTTPAAIGINLNIESVNVLINHNATAIHQLIMNLCINASQAIGKKPGLITVSLKHHNTDVTAIDGIKLEKQRYIQLMISDNGTGMSQEVKDCLFEPFFTTKEPGEGTGLGMSVVFKIVENHKGKIHIDSSIGNGTCISIFFPIATNALEHEDEIDNPATIHGTGNIMVVDDEEALTTLYKEALENLGYCVTTFNDSEEALLELKSSPDKYHLLFTDQTMPKLTGENLCREALKFTPNIKIIIATGYDQHLPIDAFNAIGVKNFLNKPVSIGKISQIINDSLSS